MPHLGAMIFIFVLGLVVGIIIGVRPGPDDR